MYRRNFPSAFVLFALTICIFSANKRTYCQSKTIQLPSAETLNNLLDKFLPRSTESFVPLKEKFALDVRIEDSFKSPVQISIIYTNADVYEITKYEFEDKSKSLLDQITELGFDNTVEQELILKKILVTKRIVKPTSSVKSHIEKLFKLSHTINPNDSFTLDGTTYRVWYRDNQSDVSYSLNGSFSRTKSEPSLITWARSLNSLAN